MHYDNAYTLFGISVTLDCPNKIGILQGINYSYTQTDKNFPFLFHTGVDINTTAKKGSET